MSRHVLLVCAAALLLAACGADEVEQEQPAAPAGDEVTVVVRPEGPGGPRNERTLDCEGADAALCDRLRRADLSPHPKEVACTQIYGGPGTARVTGRLDGKPIDVRFDLSGGCEINRWEEFSWLLGEPPTGNLGPP